MSELFIDQKNAWTFKQKADLKNIADLDQVFTDIDLAASEGKYDLDLKIQLTDVQETTLKNLGFEIGEFDEDNEEYENGYRSWVMWEDAEDPNDKN